MTPPVETVQGSGPIVLGLPHTGTFVPENIRADLNDCGRLLEDTDWHIHQLYEGLMDNVTTVRALFHRYVIDANRDPSGVSLYPGQNTTTLVPLTNFDGQDIWTTPPTEAEVQARRDAYHTPYHAALAAELERVRSLHGYVILYDCHSIRSPIPFLFDGDLPDFNIGTNQGTTCDPRIEAQVQKICCAAPGFRTVVNGRFKGGWTTRHYGRPQDGMHAIQMELSQATYLTTQSPPWAFDTPKAQRLRPHLRDILETLSALPDLAPPETPHD